MSDNRRRRLTASLEQARKTVRGFKFGTPEYDAAFEVMRGFSLALADLPSTEEFCSVDSGVHRTRLSNGRII
jgi:hypothetical protein